MALRHAAILFVAILGVHGRDLWDAIARTRRVAPAGAAHPQHVVLVVADGLRWQEVFRGADSTILFSDPSLGGDGVPTRRKYWRPTLRERRAALMPFLWGTVAREGQLIGNRDVGSRVIVTNPMKFSYPGYNEMLVGYSDPRIDRNDFGPNPNVTVFEWLNRRAELRGHVAVLGAGHLFSDIFNAKRSRLPVGDFTADSDVGAGALEYLEEHQPRALFVGFGATDQWAHKGQYDRVLDAALAIDGYVSMLWARIQSSSVYRDRTTLIVVADHGRGNSTTTWTDHGSDIAGSDETWFAMIGPGIEPLGEVRGGRATLAQTAATVAGALGLDYAGAVSRAARALPFSVHR
jgi:hypothetical protein